MSDSFLFSMQNEFGVKEPFAVRGSLVNCPTRRRPACVSLTEAVCRFGRGCCSAPSSLVGADDEGTLSRDAEHVPL